MTRRRWDPYDITVEDRPAYLPNALEIALHCRRIRKQWTAEERHCRELVKSERHGQDLLATLLRTEDEPSSRASGIRMFDRRRR